MHILYFFLLNLKINVKGYYFISFRIFNNDGKGLQSYGEYIKYYYVLDFEYY